MRAILLIAILAIIANNTAQAQYTIPGRPYVDTIFTQLDSLKYKKAGKTYAAPLVVTVDTVGIQNAYLENNNLVIIAGIDTFTIPINKMVFSQGDTNMVYGIGANVETETGLTGATTILFYRIADTSSIIMQQNKYLALAVSVADTVLYISLENGAIEISRDIDETGELRGIRLNNNMDFYGRSTNGRTQFNGLSVNENIVGLGIADYATDPAGTGFVLVFQDSTLIFSGYKNDLVEQKRVGYIVSKDNIEMYYGDQVNEQYAGVNTTQYGVSMYGDTIRIAGLPGSGNILAITETGRLYKTTGSGLTNPIIQGSYYMGVGLLPDYIIMGDTIGTLDSINIYGYNKVNDDGSAEVSNIGIGRFHSVQGTDTVIVPAAVLIASINNNDTIKASLIGASTNGVSISSRTENAGHSLTESNAWFGNDGKIFINSSNTIGFNVGNINIKSGVSYNTLGHNTTIAPGQPIVLHSLPGGAIAPDSGVLRALQYQEGVIEITLDSAKLVNLHTTPYQVMPEWDTSANFWYYKIDDIWGVNTFEPGSIEYNKTGLTAFELYYDHSDYTAATMPVKFITDNQRTIATGTVNNDVTIAQGSPLSLKSDNPITAGNATVYLIIKYSLHTSLR